MLRVIAANDDLHDAGASNDEGASVSRIRSVARLSMSELQATLSRTDRDRSSNDLRDADDSMEQGDRPRVTHY